MDLNNQAVAEGKAGRYEEAVRLLKQAVSAAPEDPLYKKNLSLALADYASELEGELRIDFALQAFEEAIALYDRNGKALVHLGNLYYLERSDFQKALNYWKKAQGHIPSAQWQAVSDRIAQLERDQSIELRFLTYKTKHFQIRFPSAEFRDQAVTVGEFLEKQYELLSQELGVNPQSLTVILYGGAEFGRLSERPDWAIGFYDGRLRIRMQDIGTDRQDWVLAHELAHAFLNEGFGNRIPTWVHEGYAQWAEPEHPMTQREGQLKERVLSGNLWIPLEWLDSHFEQPTGSEDIQRCYVQARVSIERLMAKHGADRFRSWLERLSKGEKMPAAFEAGFSPSRWSRFNQGILE